MIFFIIAKSRYKYLNEINIIIIHNYNLLIIYFKRLILYDLPVE